MRITRETIFRFRDLANISSTVLGESKIGFPMQTGLGSKKTCDAVGVVDVLLKQTSTINSLDSYLSSGFCNRCGNKGAPSTAASPVV